MAAMTRGMSSEPAGKSASLPPRSHRFVAVPGKVQAQFQELTDRTWFVSIEFADTEGGLSAPSG
jgi:hypothetical protein